MDIGIVRMYMKALKELWQPGPVAPRQRLVNRPSGNLWLHNIVGHCPHMEDWRQDKARRKGLVAHKDFYWVQQNSESPTTYSSLLLIWPGQTLTPAPATEEPEWGYSTDSEAADQ